MFTNIGTNKSSQAINYLHFVIDDGLDSDSSRSPSPTVRKKSQRSSLRSPEFVSKGNSNRNSMNS
jgi:hypothetical protein